jgi:hypothetical protein
MELTNPHPPNRHSDFRQEQLTVNKLIRRMEEPRINRCFIYLRIIRDSSIRLINVNVVNGCWRKSE